MTDKNIVIIGAGVAGLTTALLLSKNPSYNITVAAKHMPGDYDIEYASPWAGADYLPVSQKGTAAAEHDRNTWPYLRHLAQNHPEAGIHFQRTERFIRTKDLGSRPSENLPDHLSPNPWWKDLFPDFHIFPQSDLKPGIVNAFSFTSVCINTAIYLPYLLSQCLAVGVIFKRAVFTHISDAATPGVHHHSDSSPTDLIVNCTGLSASKLGGVEDRTLFPVRGQIVLVRNDPGGTFSLSGSDDAPDESAYIMMRAAGGGTVLGGCTQKGSTDSQHDPNLALRIMKRCVDLCPRLTHGRGGIQNLDVVRHAVGIRPARKGGARVEREIISGVPVVHNYGHGGAGYQSSYGCAEVAIRLVEEALSEKATL